MPAYFMEKTVFFLHSTAHELPAIKFHGFAHVKGILNSDRPLPDIFHIWPYFRSTIIEHMFHPRHIIRWPDSVAVDSPCYIIFEHTHNNLSNFSFPGHAQISEINLQHISFAPETFIRHNSPEAVPTTLCRGFNIHLDINLLCKLYFSFKLRQVMEKHIYFLSLSSLHRRRQVLLNDQIKKPNSPKGFPSAARPSYCLRPAAFRPLLTKS